MDDLFYHNGIRIAIERVWSVQESIGPTADGIEEKESIIVIDTLGPTGASVTVASSPPLGR